MRHIQKFEHPEEIQTALDDMELANPYIAFVSGYGIDYNSHMPVPPVPPEPVYSAMPLTIRALSDGFIGWERVKGVLSPVALKTITVKLNDDEPEELPGEPLMGYNVSEGDVIQIWGDNSTYANALGSSYHRFSGNCDFEVYGNLASLLSSTGFTEVDSILGQYGLCNLFAGQTGLTAVRNLSIGDNRLGGNLYAYCFRRMFQGCSNLNYIKIMLDRTIDHTYSKQITDGVSATGTFVKPSGATWETGVDGIPTGWEVINL